MSTLTHAPHLHGRMSKARLAEHLGEPHVHDGRALRHVERLSERLRWSKEELVRAHEDMHMPRNDHFVEREDA